MLAVEMNAASLPEFVFDDDYCFERKEDGHRILLHCNAHSMVACNRSGEVSQHNEDFQNSIWEELKYKLNSDTVIFDGEYIDETLYVFDLPLFGSGWKLGAAPYYLRRNALEMIIKDSNVLGVPMPMVLVDCATEPHAKALLAAECIRHNAEGVMVKNMNGLYEPGLRSKSLLKAKFVKTADLIVFAKGVKGRDGKVHNNAALAAYNAQGKLIQVGRCSLNGKPDVEIGTVVEVEYLYFVDKLVQPNLLHVRTDKAAKDCFIDQLIPTNKAALTG